MAPLKLRRVRNILANQQVALLFDHYDEDWERLGYVLLEASATMVASEAERGHAVALLRERYPQYHALLRDNSPVIRIEPHRAVIWRASAAV